MRRAWLILIGQGIVLAFVVWFLVFLLLGSAAELVDSLPPG